MAAPAPAASAPSSLVVYRAAKSHQQLLRGRYHESVNGARSDLHVYTDRVTQLEHVGAVTAVDVRGISLYSILKRIRSQCPAKYGYHIFSSSQSAVCAVDSSSRLQILPDAAPRTYHLLLSSSITMARTEFDELLALAEGAFIPVAEAAADESSSDFPPPPDTELNHYTSALLAAWDTAAAAEDYNLTTIGCLFDFAEIYHTQYARNGFLADRAHFKHTMRLCDRGIVADALRARAVQYMEAGLDGYAELQTEAEELFEVAIHDQLTSVGRFAHITFEQLSDAVLDHPDIDKLDVQDVVVAAKILTATHACSFDEFMQYLASHDIPSVDRTVPAGATGMHKLSRVKSPEVPPRQS